MADDLTYNYELGNKSNRLKNVADPMGDMANVSEYVARGTGNCAYDANGNMTADPGKGTTITYNYLNLPECVSFTNNKGKLFYHYDAAGRKLAQFVENNDGGQNKLTDYVGGTVYTDNQPSFAATEEGRIVPDGQGGWRHEYYLKDHLGNTRAVVAGTLVPGGADLLQTTSYYPFGLTMVQTDYNNETTNYRKNRYLYNGKELQSDGFGGVELGWLDYGARFYDPAGVSWTTVDPLTDVNPHMSPYAFVSNNPINRIDPTGMLDSPIYGTDGEFLGTDDEGLTGKPIVMERSDFKQGMSHSDAMKKDIAPNGGNEYLSAIPDADHYTSFYNHYNGLKTDLITTVLLPSRKVLIGLRHDRI